MESWISNHFYDLHGDGQSQRVLLAFLDTPIIKSGFQVDCNRIRALLRNQVTIHLMPRRILLDGAPDPVAPAEQDIAFLTLNDLDDKEIARQLTLIDQALFQAIRPQELLRL
jgi:hypothetical protein